MAANAISNVAINRRLSAIESTLFQIIKDQEDREDSQDELCTEDADTYPAPLQALEGAAIHLTNQLQKHIDKRTYKPDQFDRLLQAHRKAQECAFYIRDFLERL